MYWDLKSSLLWCTTTSLWKCLKKKLFFIAATSWQLTKKKVKKNKIFEALSWADLKRCISKKFSALNMKSCLTLSRMSAKVFPQLSSAIQPHKKCINLSLLFIKKGIACRTFGFWLIFFLSLSFYIFLFHMKTSFLFRNEKSSGTVKWNSPFVRIEKFFSFYHKPELLTWHQNASHEKCLKFNC